MVKCGKIYAIHMQDRHAALDDWQKSQDLQERGQHDKDYEDFKKFILQSTTIDLNAYKERQMKRRIDTLISRNKYDGYDSYSQAIIFLFLVAPLLQFFYHGGWAAYCAVDRRAEFFLPGEDCLRTDIAVHAGRCPFLHFFYKGRSAFWRTVQLGGCDAITEFPVDGQLIADLSILRCAEKFLQTARQIFAPDSVLCDCLSG